MPALTDSATEREHGDEIREHERHLYFEMIGEVEPMAGARELITDLSDRGQTVVLASSATPEQDQRTQARMRAHHHRRHADVPGSQRGQHRALRLADLKAREAEARQLHPEGEREHSRWARGRAGCALHDREGLSTHREAV